MRVSILQDEQYPFYTVTLLTGWAWPSVEVDDETYERWAKTLTEFAALQAELEELSGQALDGYCPFTFDPRNV